MNTHSKRRTPTDYSFENLFVGGEWRRGSSGRQIRVTNPWTDETVAAIEGASCNDVDLAFKSAQACQGGWARLLPSQRADVFRRAALTMESRQAEIVSWLVRESGSTLAKAQIEWWAVHASLQEASTLPSRIEGRILTGDYADKENRIYRLPVGVVAVISPWNWPLHLSMRSIAPALALGNAAVLKPSVETPVTGGLLIARLFEEAGLPPGVLNVVAGQSSEIGDAFVSHPIPRVISFTGSTEVGRHVGKLAVSGTSLKRAMLELGGNGPLIITDDVDLDHAVHTAIVGKFLHQGQMCIAVNRIIVADSIHDAFVERFVSRTAALKTEDPEDPTTAIGPVINARQRDRLVSLIEIAKKEGARLRLGGETRGLRVPPHIFDNVVSDMEVARQEIFGPIATVIRARDDTQAIEIANDTEYGLTSGVLCNDEGRAMRIAKCIRAGMTHINDIPAIDMPQLPFGGEKSSGFGRFGSHGMIETFTREHWISVQLTKASYPF